MVKDYIRNDEKYSYFNLVRIDLYESIEKDERLSSLVKQVFNYSQKQKSGVDISEKDVKRYLAWTIFENYGCSRENFFKETPSGNLCELIYSDFCLFHGG